MPGVGVAFAVLGYGMLYTLYQKTWGSGGSFLYWVSGSTRFPGPAASAPNKNTTAGATGVQTPQTPSQVTRH